jgi:glycosyltransferase involved in cell wall biosynthesis
MFKYRREIKINILYIVSTLRSSGPTNQLYGLIKNLDKDIFDPIILTLSPEPEDSKINEFLNLDIEIKSLSLSRLEMMLKGKDKLINKVKSINPDLIHSSGIRPDINVNKYLKKYPHCCTIRNYAYDDYPVKFGIILGNIMAYQHIRAFRSIDYPISCSYAIKNRYKKEKNINTDVVQNGIDASEFTLIDSKKKIELRKKLNLDQNKKVFITVGSLIDRKAPLMLIKSFKKAKLSEKAELIVLGEGSLYKECKNLASSNIILRGHVDNVDEYLQASDIFVSASKSEGLPNAVLEAMGTGLPILISDIEPHKEIFERNNDIGKLFKLNNTRDLTNKLKEYSKFNNETLKNKGTEARETLEKYFSAEVMSKSYQEKYMEIINN